MKSKKLKAEKREELKRKAKKKTQAGASLAGQVLKAKTAREYRKTKK
jgi:hypothetical protein